MTKNITFKNELTSFKDKKLWFGLGIYSLVCLFIASLLSYEVVQQPHFLTEPTTSTHFNQEVFYPLLIFLLPIPFLIILSRNFHSSGIEKIISLNITFDTDSITINHKKANLKINTNDFFTITKQFKNRGAQTIIIRSSEGLAIVFDSLQPVKGVITPLITLLEEHATLNYEKDMNWIGNERTNTYTLINIDLTN